MPITLASFIVMLASVGILRCQGEIIQDPLVEGSEGQKLSLSCKHPQISNENIFWYRQRPNEAPHSIVSGYKDSVKSEILDGAMTITSDRKVNEFSFNRVTLRDSGVYYCALGESQGTWKVTFGNGTQLVVTPDLEDSEPSIYKLQPAKEEDAKISACLVTDYFPASIEVGAKGTAAQKVNSSIVIVKENDKETPSYGTVFWGPGEKADGCYAKQKEKTFQPELAESATTCSKTGGFETDESLNLLSLTVLGLRVIFLKCVAFNLLFTFHAWSS